jgi:hypothetical protein
MDPTVFSQLQSNAEQAYKPPRLVATQQPTARKSGGVAGFIGGVAHGLVDPFVATGKALAYAPAAIGREIRNKSITDLQQKAFGTTNQGDIARKIVGNTAQVGLTLAAPGANTVKKAATMGVATGASSALTKKGSTANDVVAGGLAGGATGGALGIAGKVFSKVASKGASGSSNNFAKNLTTQGQQAQGRVTGISAGSKVAGKELTPQDTAQMLDTLKTEGIKTGNANNTLRDITDKLKGYGQQISDHFKTNNAPLHADDTKQIADNFITGLKTTDPGVLKEAQIVADDLQKNVKNTKDLWEFRKSLDSRIPDSKFMDAATTNKVTALKEMRQYISSELGDIPGASRYHALSEIKPFISAEAKRLNNPSGGVVGRVLSSGIAQKTENAVGKGTETLAQKLSRGEPAPPIERGIVDETQPLKAVASSSSPPPPPPSSPALEGEVINPGATSNGTPSVEPPQPTPVGIGFMNKMLGKTIPAVKSSIAPAIRQGAAAQAGGAMVPGQDQIQSQSQMPDASTGLLDNGADTSGQEQPQDTSPFAPANIQDNIQKILAQGGTMKDVSEFLANAKAFNDLTGSTNGAKKPISATAADAIANAQSGIQSLDTIEQELANNPGVQQKSAASQIANPFGITSRIAGTGKYDAALSQAKDVIARLRTGAAISNSEEKRFTAMLPQPLDSKDVVTQKLNLLRNALNTIVQRVGGNGSDLIQEAAQVSQ